MQHAMDPRIGAFMRFMGGPQGRGGGRGRHGGHGHGRGGPWGPGGPWGRGGFNPPRRRMRRGDVRAALLVLLDEEPRNGYALMQEIERRTNGVWRPSPGSVYPALSQLEDEGLVLQEESEGRKSYKLTDDGAAYVEENREELGQPWQTVLEDSDESALDLRGLMFGIGGAVMQIVTGGNQAQIDQAREVLKNARRDLYKILAEDPPTEA
jgi:DNA-binding PadR family transcriptional regulator